MSKFKPGEIIIALSTKVCSVNPREEGKEYVVHGTTKCPRCMEEFVCINNKIFTKAKKIKCSACGSIDIQSSHAWTLASNFRSKDNFNPHEELKRAIEVEDYMRAAELRDIINKQKNETV